jgi:hypothetical protein
MYVIYARVTYTSCAQTKLLETYHRCGRIGALLHKMGLERYSIRWDPSSLIPTERHNAVGNYISMSPKQYVRYRKLRRLTILMRLSTISILTSSLAFLAFNSAIANWGSQSVC